jgi:hypothetical protein
MDSIVHAIITKYATGENDIDLKNPLDNTCTGGTPAHFLNMVRELQKLGHIVRAFGSWKKPMIIDGVEYLPLNSITKYGNPNVWWADYDVSPLIGKAGALRIGSHHTYRLDKAAFEWIDVNTIPSQAALNTLKPFYDPWGKWVTLPNAIPDDIPKRDPVPGRVLYHTSADRGLHHLISMWPEIRRRVPYATLHFRLNQQWLDWASLWQFDNSELGKRARLLKQDLISAELAGGFTRLPDLPRSEMWKEISQASVFAFPCDVRYPCETFSISTMECCKVGVPVVLCTQDSLKQIYGGYVLSVEPPVSKQINEFIDLVVTVLTDKEVAQEYSILGKNLASQYTYSKAGKKLSDIICEHTGWKRP